MTRTMKLISMTDFVLEQHGFSDVEVRLNIPFANERFRERVSNYANFLKQPLKLEMFVPCDEEGNVLEEPSKEDKEWFLNQTNSDFSERYTYVFNWFLAKEKVLFEDCELYKDVYVVDKNNFQIVLNLEHVVTITKDNIIEDLSFSDNYYLTSNAIKQLGL